jgi:predicted nucleotidyltransferase component of viral defense system
MILIKQEDILHKAQMLRLLAGIVDNPILSPSLHFKGGTCASMLGFLDRFSVDLDFDLIKGADKRKLDSEFRKLFKKLNLEVVSDKREALFYVVKYKAPKNQRNALKVSATDEVYTSNVYKTVMLPEINRLVSCQTIETMFANKLVAATDRYKKHKKIAGRDIYDVRYFFSKGYKFNPKIIEERTDMKAREYIRYLADFIEKKVTDRVITEDLNTLLPYEKFKEIRKTLKSETLIFLRSLV